MVGAETDDPQVCTVTATEADRIVTLDVIRGIAVMGIFSVNVVTFAMPIGAYFNPAGYGGWHGYDYALWLANFILVDGKMRGLFSMLFGASAMLVIDRAEATARSAARTHYARMATLLMLGIAHFYLLWFGDILTLYAVCGMILFAMRRWPVHWLVGGAIALLLIDLVVMGGLSAFFLSTSAAMDRPLQTVDAAESWRSLNEGFGTLDAKALAKDLAIHRASWWTIAHHRLTEQLTEPLEQLGFGGVETLGYMLAGAAGFRSGFLTGAWDAARYRRIALWTIPPGMAAFAILAAWMWSRGFDPGVVATAQFFGAALPRLAMIFGYAALIALLAKQRASWTDRVAAVGRCAFSNYLGTSIVAGFIFYGYGLGLYGHVSRAQAWAVVPLFWLGMLLWSKPWLSRYRFGPFEWLWRSLSRGRLQPMQR
jgi:uncharacterized protein